jgi:hypothetical protein
VLQNRATKWDDHRLTYAEGEARGGRRSSLRTNPLQPPLFTQDMALKGTNKSTLVQYVVNI